MTEKTKRPQLFAARASVFPTYHVECDGRGGFWRVTVSGVIGVAQLSEDEIKLMTVRESLKISGSQIKMSVFERKTVEIFGKINNISIGASGKRAKNDKA